MAYHISLLKNKKSILINGLVPSIGNNSQSCEEKTPAIYLFPDETTMNDALLNWFSELYEEEILSVFQVDIAGLDITHNGYELISYNTIPKEKITFIKNI